MQLQHQPGWRQTSCAQTGQSARSSFGVVCLLRLIAATGAAIAMVEPTSARQGNCLVQYA
jgi:hypothetical protein